MIHVLVVCMANVCRSPIACAVANTLLASQHPRPQGLKGLLHRPAIVFRSAGTSAPKKPEPADVRAQLVLRQRGYDSSGIRSRRISAKDFERFDLILAMDNGVLEELTRQCPAELQGKLHLFLDFTPGTRGQNVPDPYYSDLKAFEHVLDLCEIGAQGVLDSMLAHHAKQ